MSDYSNRPPMPGGMGGANNSQQGSPYDPRGAYDDYGTTAVQPYAGDGGPRHAAPKRGGAGKAFLAGLLGVILGAALVLGGLYLGGVRLPFLPAQQTTSVVRVEERGSSSDDATTVNGQQVVINSEGDDVTLANAVAAKALPSVVSVYVESDEGSGMGSGVILDTDGNILTNYHVAGDATSLSVSIDGKSYDAELVGTDASSDLAVIKADFGDLKVTPIERGDSSALKVGDWVMTVGSPFGLDQSVSSGIVSSLYRSTMISDTSGNSIYANLIQVDASINPGNSGGALVNSKGQLVGISTLYTSSTESFAGIGFAIDGNYALRIADAIVAGEPVEHAYIGLSMATVNAQNARSNKLSVNQGAYIAEVVADGPADQAGIQVGDVITAIDGQQISSADGVILAVRSHTPGDEISVDLMRGDEELSVSVTLGSDEGTDVAGGGQQQRQRDERQPYDQREQYYDFNDYYQWLEQLFGMELGR